MRWMGSCVLLAVLWQAWIWIDGAPFAIAAAALLGTLPLLWRRRFPFGAPVLVFAALVGVSLADPETGADFVVLTPFSGLALALAFWFAGGHEKREQAFAATAIGLASVVAVARRQGEEFVVTGADSDLGIVGLLLIAAGLASALIRPPAASARRRPARAASRPARAGARGTNARRGGRRARPHRGRPPRRDRAQRERYDRPGWGRPTPARRGSAACPGTTALGRGDRTAGACRHAPPARAPTCGRGGG